MLKLDPASARLADNFGSFINEPGKYIGVFTRAEKLTAKSGAQGLGLSFTAEDGSTADYLDLYHLNAQGVAIPSKRMVDAIMAVMRQREMDASLITVEKWDNVSRSRRQMQVPGYPLLMNKPIGLVLRKLIETRSDTGADSEKMEIFCVFEPGTNLTATEILDRITEPKKLEAAMRVIEARGTVDKRTSKPAPVSTAASSGAASSGAASMDDMPF